MTTQLEFIFRAYLDRLGVEYIEEYQFAKPRKFRADFYLPEYKILIEIEGGLYMKSRHTSPKGYHNDCEKYNLAALLGYKVLRFTTKHVQEADHSVLEKLI